MTLVSAFNRIFEKYKSKAAIEFDGHKVTFAEINRKANKVADSLRKNSVYKGDRVAVFLGNSLELVYFFVGALKNGSIVVPMNISFMGMEAEYMLNDSGAKAVLADKETLPIIKNILPKLKELKHIITVGCNEFTDFNDFIKDASVKERDVKITGEDGSIIFYTSGTTGRSKGALLSHHNMESDLGALKEAWHLNDKDKLLLALPLYHIHGLGVALCGSFCNGCSLVLRKRFDAE